jgi:FlaA1/EpsC-like NDP-sugar epimerase
MLMNPELGYRPVGFLDSDTLKRGRKIHGIEVLGGPGELAEILKGQQIEGLVITNDADLPRAAQAQLVATCQAHGLWVRRLRLEFELVE